MSDINNYNVTSKPAELGFSSVQPALLQTLYAQTQQLSYLVFNPTEENSLTIDSLLGEMDKEMPQAVSALERDPRFNNSEVQTLLQQWIVEGWQGAKTDLNPFLLGLMQAGFYVLFQIEQKPTGNVQKLKEEAWNMIMHPLASFALSSVVENSAQNWKGFSTELDKITQKMHDALSCTM